MISAIARVFVLPVWLIASAQVLADNIGLVARVNGQEITAKRFEHYFGEFLTDRGRNIASIRNPEALRKLRREALDALVDEELLSQEARREGIAATPAEIDAAMEAMRAKFKSRGGFARRLKRAGFDEAGYRAHLGQQLAVKRLVETQIQPKVTVSDNEARRFYKANPSRFAIPAKARLRQILIAKGSDPADVRRRCDDVLARARRPRSDFAKLARQYSQDQNAAQGGNLGPISPGQLPPPLEQAAAGLKPGQVADAVETETGCHILKLEQRRRGALPEAEAREMARSHVKTEKTQQAVRRRIESLRRQAKIEVLMPL